MASIEGLFGYVASFLFCFVAFLLLVGDVILGYGFISSLWADLSSGGFVRMAAVVVICLGTITGYVFIKRRKVV